MIIKPMNAKPITDRNFLAVVNDPNYIIERKIKGNRGVWYTPGSDNNAHHKFLSRGKDLNRVHKMPHLFNGPFSSALEACIFDGELYDDALTDAQVAGILSSNHKLMPSTSKYAIFDILMFDGIDITNKPLKYRLALLDEAFKYIPTDRNIARLPHIVSSKEDAEKMFKAIVEDGGEGIMLKNLNACYQPGKRPEHHWYKWKREHTSDVIITGFTEAKFGKTGKWDGLIGAIKYGVFNGTHILPIGQASGQIDDKLRAHMTKNPHLYVGKVMEIKYDMLYNGTPKEPRFIRMRHDKDPKECTLQQLLEEGR